MMQMMGTDLDKWTAGWPPKAPKERSRKRSRQ